MQEIQWRYYPHVAENPITRAFIESQAKRQKRPKTVDAYARNVEDLIKAFTDFGFPDLIEATPDQMEAYLESLFYRTPARPRYNIIPLSRNTLSLGVKATGRPQGDEESCPAQQARRGFLPMTSGNVSLLTSCFMSQHATRS